MTEFVEGWSIVQTLGEGTYGEVKLLTNRNTDSAVAMKTIDLAKHPNDVKAVRKEIIIHKDLSHPHIIRFYGQRQNGSNVYIFLEYASGGELFDRIEPDVGMLSGQAQKFFQQLLSGVEYLHMRGIAHRDLKPENLLLDDNGNLKISDFGMATYFRFEGKERLLDKRCGTLPYVAPEVLQNSYAGEPADIWSCGIILVALLAGELPWDQPSNDCEEYKNWKTNKYMQVTPWSKLDTLALSLARKILVPSPRERYSIASIRNHRWYKKRFSESCTSCDVTDSPYGSKLSFSQPQDSRKNEVMNDDDDMSDIGYSFSQPTQIDDLLLSTQLLLSQPATASTNCVQKLVRRMTRFFVNVNVDHGAACLTEAITKLGYMWKIFTPGVLTVSTLDRRKSPLTFKASILDMNGQTLMDFRLSKGCGLEFKRCFIAIRKELNAIIIKGQVSWASVS